MTVSTWTTAAAGVFALLLVLAGMAKLVAPVEFPRTAGRVLPPSWSTRHPRFVAQSGRLTAVVELVAAPVVAAGGVIGAGVACVLSVVFGGAVFLARRRGASCGCWGSLSPGQAGGAEIGRAVVLVAMTGAALAGRLAGAAPEWRPATALAAVALCGTLVAAGHVGGRLISSPGKPRTRAGRRRPVVGFLLAAPPERPVAALGRPLWPVRNHRTLRRWQADGRVRTELARLGMPQLAWRRAVVYEHGAERRALINGEGVQLVVSEVAAEGQRTLRCRATRRP